MWCGPKYSWTGAESIVPWYKYWDELLPEVAADAAWTTIIVVVPIPPHNVKKNRVYTTVAAKENIEEDEDDGTTLRVGFANKATMVAGRSIALFEEALRRGFGRSMSASS